MGFELAMTRLTLFIFVQEYNNSSPTFNKISTYEKGWMGMRHYHRSDGAMDVMYPLCTKLRFWGVRWTMWSTHQAINQFFRSVPLGRMLAVCLWSFGQPKWLLPLERAAWDIWVPALPGRQAEAQMSNAQKPLFVDGKEDGFVWTWSVPSKNDNFNGENEHNPLEIIGNGGTILSHKPR